MFRDLLLAEIRISLLTYKMTHEDLLTDEFLSNYHKFWLNRVQINNLYSRNSQMIYYLHYAHNDFWSTSSIYKLYFIRFQGRTNFYFKLWPFFFASNKSQIFYLFLFPIIFHTMNFCYVCKQNKNNLQHINYNSRKINPLHIATQEIRLLQPCCSMILQ